MNYLWVALIFGMTAINGFAASAKVVKVLPHLLDREGRHTLSPSLYDRDAYQAQLRRRPDQRAGLCFDVQWKAATRSPLVLRVEARGARDNAATTVQLETQVRRRGWFRSWSRVTLTSEEYQRLGELMSWRATLWEGDQLLAQAQSFLW